MARFPVAFLQLPPLAPGGAPARENHPLAAAYLAGFARSRGLGADFEFWIPPAELADMGGDEAIVRAIVEARPRVLGLTLYVWNVARSLAIAARVKRERPEVLVVAGGPEVVATNRWIFESRAIDLGVAGEGEEAFAAILARLAGNGDPAAGPGLLIPPASSPGGVVRATGPAPRIDSLDRLPSPYLDGWIDAGRDRFLYLETARGCVFRCTFCRYDADSGGPVATLSKGRVAAVLAHGRDAGVREIFFLDPTLNQRKDAKEVLRVAIEQNPDRRMRLGGELVAELVDSEFADLAAAAGFHTVEVGLQSIHKPTLRAVRRLHHREKFLAGVRMLAARGIRCRVDLIIGLPEETLDSFRRAVDFVKEEGLAGDIQVFDLLVLPGTVLHTDRERLRLLHRSYPPYTVLSTPTLSADEMLAAGRYAEETLGVRLAPEVRRRRYRPEERIDLDSRDDPPAIERVRRHDRRFLALSVRGPLGESAGLARRALVPWLEANPFASFDLALYPEGPEHLGPLEDLILAVQPPPETLGGQIYRRVFLVLAKPATRFPPAWRRHARRLAHLRTSRRLAPGPTRGSA